jgi:hypothetical protein
MLAQDMRINVAIARDDDVLDILALSRTLFATTFEPAYPQRSGTCDISQIGRIIEKYCPLVFQIVTDDDGCECPLRHFDPKLTTGQIQWQ